MITYEQIQKVNDEMTFIDVKGKNYAMVPQRVTAFRKLYPEGFIITELLSNDGGVCVMRASAGYYMDGEPVTLGTGLAYEKETSSYINRTSYIENCETSAVGRALGFLGLGIEGGGICSAEELANAINNQEKPAKAPAKAPVKDAPATVMKVQAVPAAEKNPNDYIREEIAKIQGEMRIGTYEEARAMVVSWIDILIKGKVIQPVDYTKITMDEAKAVFREIRSAFVAHAVGDRR